MDAGLVTLLVFCIVALTAVILTAMYYHNDKEYAAGREWSNMSAQLIRKDYELAAELAALKLKLATFDKEFTTWKGKQR